MGTFQIYFASARMECMLFCKGTIEIDNVLRKSFCAQKLGQKTLFLGMRPISFKLRGRQKKIQSRPPTNLI
ncbi:MAG: hypothetical protein DRQ99_10885 [Candidatus Parabeggiatoa sp. nov. 3]|nr:MAG: hypothetical protein DRQ99_10885 [Gammaproteobacteria bacterium]